VAAGPFRRHQPEPPATTQTAAAQNPPLITQQGRVGAGAAIAIIGTAVHSYLSMPLGIAVAVLGAIVLVLYALTKSRTKATAAAFGRVGKRHVKAESTGPHSVAADLALLADLYSRGALSTEEFSAAKRRILES